mgnify:CR=1 FL=1
MRGARAPRAAFTQPGVEPRRGIQRLEECGGTRNRLDTQARAEQSGTDISGDADQMSNAGATLAEATDQMSRAGAALAKAATRSRSTWWAGGCAVPLAR